MGAAREGYDLFHKHGRSHFWNRIKRRRFPKEVWGDTFNQIWCKVVGHNEYNSGVGGDYEPACRRCHHFLPGARYVQRDQGQINRKELKP